MLAIGSRRLATTAAGFLVEAAEWDEEVAQALAVSQGLELSEAHWEIVRFIRDYHDRFRHLPNMRMFVKAVHKSLGPEKGNSRYLHRLFPDGPLRQACLIAGLPKPPACL